MHVKQRAGHHGAVEWFHSPAQGQLRLRADRLDRVETVSFIKSDPIHGSVLIKHPCAPGTITLLPSPTPSLNALLPQMSLGRRELFPATLMRLDRTTAVSCVEPGLIACVGSPQNFFVVHLCPWCLRCTCALGLEASCKTDCATMRSVDASVNPHLFPNGASLQYFQVACYTRAKATKCRASTTPALLAVGTTHRPHGLLYPSCRYTWKP